MQNVHFLELINYVTKSFAFLLLILMWLIWRYLLYNIIVI